MSNDWEPHYEAWRADPTPDQMNAVVTALAPTIQQQLARSGMHQDPLMKAKARTLAASAVSSWEPGKGSNLPTWVGHQMTQLHRFRRLNSQVLQVPEGLQLDALKLENARRSFEDEHGRDPDEDELSDYSGLPLRRMRDIRIGTPTTPGSAALAEGIGQQTSPEHTVEAMAAVYGDSDKVDRTIMEGRLGYNNRPQRPTLHILQATKLSPPQLARRVTALARRIQAVTSDLEHLYGTAS
jgi:hypothetical protein